MNKLIVMLALLGSMLTVMGCGNTADGVGRDVDRAVDEVKDATN